MHQAKDMSLRRLLLILLFVIGSVAQGMATHIMGGEITYNYLGFFPGPNPYRYQVKLVAYVYGGPGSNFGPNSPSPGALGNNPRMGIYRLSSGARLRELTIVGRVEETSPNLPRNCNPQCLNGLIIYKNTFDTIINLPFDARGYIFFYQTAARNNTINIGVGDSPINPIGNTFQAIAPSPGEFPNSSPQFTDQVIPFFLTNQTTTVINTAVDPDGDRLQYRFVYPFNGRLNNPNPPFYEAPNEVAFLNGFTEAQPFGTANGAFSTINASTGLSTYRATQPGAYVVTIEILEFRAREGLSDTLIGRTRREIQVFIRESGNAPDQCPPNDPPRKVSNYQPTYTISAGESLAFDLAFADSDQMGLSAVSEILGNVPGNYRGNLATLPSAAGTGNVSSRFTWISSCAYPGTYPIRITVADSGCPPAITRDVVTINVLPFRGPRSISGPISTCSNVQSYRYSVTGRPAGSRAIWRITGGRLLSDSVNTDSVRVRWTASNGQIKLFSISNAGCVDSVEMLVVNSTVPVITASADVNICQGQSTVLGVSGSTFGYTWTPSTGLSSATVSNPVARPRVTTTYIVTSRLPSGCLSADTVVVNVIQALANVPDQSTCERVQIPTPLNISNTRYRWLNTDFFAEGSVDTTPQPIIVFPQNEAGRRISYILRTVRRFGTESCTFFDTIQVRQFPSPIGQLRRGNNDTILCSNDTLKLSSQGNPDFSYQWKDVSGGAVLGTGPRLNYVVSTNRASEVKRVYLESTSTTGGCVRRDTVPYLVQGLPRIVPAMQQVCYAVPTRLAVPDSSGRLDYSWLPQVGLSDLDSVQATFQSQGPPAATPTTLNLRLRLTNRLTGCQNVVLVPVTVQPFPLKQAGNDTATCTQVPIRLGLPAAANQRYLWRSIATPDSVTVAFGDTTTAQFVVTAVSRKRQEATILFQKLAINTLAGCETLDTVVLRVPGIPLIDAAPSDTLVFCPGDTFRLGYKGISGGRYKWTPATDLSDTNQSFTRFTAVNRSQVTLFRRYILEVIEPINNCKVFDTVVVKVNPNPVVVPDSQRLCSGNSITLGQPVVAVYRYAWTPNTGLNSDTLAQPTLSLIRTGLRDTTITYRLLITNRLTGCVDSSKTKVRLVPLPPVNAGKDTAICSQATTFLGVDQVVPQIYSYVWQAIDSTPDSVNIRLGNTLAPSLTISASSSKLLSASIRYRLTMTDITSLCQNSDTAVLTILPLPRAKAADTDTLYICAGAPLITLGKSQPDTGRVFRWRGTRFLSADTIAAPIYQRANAGLDTLYEQLIVRETNRLTQCFKEDTVVVGVFPLPKINRAGDSLVCSGEKLRLPVVARAGFSYRWKASPFIDSLAQASPTFVKTIAPEAPTTIDTLTVYITNDRTLCLDSFQVKIVTRAKPLPNAGIDVSVCLGDTATVGALPKAGQSYSWSPIARPDSVLPIRASQLRLSLANATAGPRLDTLVLTASVDSTGCESKDTVVIRTWPAVIAPRIGPSPLRFCPFTEGVRFRLANGQPGYRYVWQVTGGTLVSGQGTDSLLVNWGDSTNSAAIIVQSFTAENCIGQFDTIRIIINRTLKPIAPDGNTRLCADERFTQSYRTPVATGSTYLWYTSDNATTLSTTTDANFTTITVRWAGAGLGRLWVKENSSTRTPSGDLIFCEGFSDTSFVRILPSPDSNLVITGDTSLCAGGSRGIYRLDGQDGSRYEWLITGLADTLANRTTSQDTIHINWENAGSYQIRVRERTDSGCVGPYFTRQVEIRPLPATQVQINDSLVCLESLQNRLYRVQGLPESSFRWTVVGGVFANEDTNTLKTDSIRVNWLADAPVKTIQVQEVTVFGCTAAPVNLPIQYDGSRLEVTNLTRDEDNDSLIVMTYRLNLPDQNRGDSLKVLRRDPGQSLLVTISDVAKTSQTFSQQLPTARSIFDYTVVGNNLCGVGLSDSVFSLLTLNGTLKGSDEQGMNWNRFVGWVGGVNRYEIYRQLDEETGFTLYETVDGTVLDFPKVNGGAGFKHTYRVKAIANNGNESWSNRIKMDFDNILSFNNVITVGSYKDGINDFLVFKHLELYRKGGSASLKVFNRWGNLVYENGNYQNDYDGSDVVDGVYYFSLEITGLRPQTVKGNLTVLK